MKLFHLSSLLLASFTTAILAAPQAGAESALKKPKSELEVSARLGKIIGHYVNNDTSVREFLGIPYAIPPIKHLRFAPSQKRRLPHRPIEAKSFGASCLPAKYTSPTLSGSPITLAPPSREDEDCLNLNIWAPSQVRLKGKKAAVLFWVYGGGFMIGTSETPLYKGFNIVRDQEDVIVVTINYRVNIFGFPALPGKNKNVGLTDIRTALEWVRDNISAFGGDPKRITLFGQSAGGALTDGYLFAYPKNPIIHAAIPQSGTLPALVTNPTSAPGTLWARITAATNCSSPSNSTSTGLAGKVAEAKTLACMRRLPAKLLRDTLEKENLQFGPSIDNNTVPYDIMTRLEEGKFARVPILLGNTDMEVFGNSTEAKEGTRRRFTCPEFRSARAHTKYGPTYHYRWFGSFPSQAGVGTLGPFHGSEISSVFGTYLKDVAPVEQVETSKFMQQAWVEFAKDPINGLKKLGWPNFDTEKDTLIRLAYDNKPEATFVNPNIYAAGC